MNVGDINNEQLKYQMSGEMATCRVGHIGNAFWCLQRKKGCLVNFADNWSGQPDVYVMTLECDFFTGGQM